MPKKPVRSKVTQQEKNQSLLNDLLRVLNRGGELDRQIGEVLRLIQQATQFSAVGLRLASGDDWPYFEQRGFTDEFLCRENSLCASDGRGAIKRDSNGQAVLECTCGLVLSGRTDPSMACFTVHGSFWTNHSTDLLGLDADPRVNPRNRCIHAGYQSVGLFPIKAGQEIIGLLQLNDKSEGRFTPELIAYYENIAQNIGLALQRTRAKESLRKSEARLARSQEIAHLGSWELDLEKNELTWSDEVYRIFGLEPQEFGATYEAFLTHVHPEDRAVVDDAYSGSIKEGEDTYEVEHRVIRARTGEVRWVQEKCEHVRNPAGKIIQSLGMVLDITERKRAEAVVRESEAKYRSLFDHMLEGFAYCQMLFDKHGHPTDFVYLTVNEAFARLTGLENVIGRRVSEVIPGIRELHPEVFEIYGRVAATGNPEELEVDFKPLGLCLSIAVYSPAREYFVAVFHDITERKRAEAALLAANANLERIVQERTAELALRATQLRALAGELTLTEQRERSRLAKVLHDHLQQLLVAAKFRITILGRGGDAVIRQAVNEVEELVDESLSVSRSLTAELSPPILHEAGLNAGLQWLARRVADKQGLFVDLDLEDDGDLPHDIKALLFESVRELLFNVAKHAHTRSATVNVRRVDDHLQVIVADQGVGFDPATMLPPGRRAEDLDYSASGSGWNSWEACLRCRAYPARGVGSSYHYHFPQSRRKSQKTRESSCCPKPRSWRPDLPLLAGRSGSSSLMTMPSSARALQTFSAIRMTLW